jgi:hypothetical protein
MIQELSHFFWTNKSGRSVQADNSNGTPHGDDLHLPPALVGSRENGRRTHLRTSLSVAVLAVLVLYASATGAQDKATFHVNSIHKETSEEHGADKAAIPYLKIVGTFEGKTYTIEALDAACNEVLQAGKDYPATLTLKKSDLIVESTFKGKPQKIHWRILTVEE